MLTLSIQTIILSLTEGFVFFGYSSLNVVRKAFSKQNSLIKFLLLT